MRRFPAKRECLHQVGVSSLPFPSTIVILKKWCQMPTKPPTILSDFPIPSSSSRRLLTPCHSPSSPPAAHHGVHGTSHAIATSHHAPIAVGHTPSHVAPHALLHHVTSSETPKATPASTSPPISPACHAPLCSVREVRGSLFRWLQNQTKEKLDRIRGRASFHGSKCINTTSASAIIKFQLASSLRPNATTPVLILLQERKSNYKLVRSIPISSNKGR